MNTCTATMNSIKKANSKGFFRKMFEGMQKTQMIRAEQEIKRLERFLPEDK